MTDSTKAIVYNAVPLGRLAALYAALGLSLLKALRRDRSSAHSFDWAFALVYIGAAIAAAIFAGLVVNDRQPLGGKLWVSLAATVVAIVPALLLVLARGRGRGAAGGVGRGRAAEASATTTRLELEAVARVSTSLSRAR